MLFSLSVVHLHDMDPYKGIEEGALQYFTDTQLLQVLMRTLADSELAVSVYPSFAYNSLGGGGLADATVEGGRVNISFNPTAVNIPPVDARTTKFLGVPMVPGLRIDVVPAKLEVRLSVSRGKIHHFFSLTGPQGLWGLSVLTVYS